MNEDKATRYHRLGRRAALLSAVWGMLILSGLLFSGASAAIRDGALALAGGSAAVTVVAYVLVFSILFDALMLPFSLYSGFLLEHRYGLATEQIGRWCTDHLKAAFIGLLFAEAGAVFVYFTIRNWPGFWWLIAAAGYSLVIVVLVNLAPVVLLPLFYTFRPLGNAELRDRLTALAERAGTRVMGVYEWTLSDRTRKANAALTGLGSTRRILLSDTLLSEYSPDEIEVILAHELAHHVHRDIWTSVRYDLGLTFAGFFVADRVLRAAVPYLELRGAADPAGIPLLLITAGAIGFVVRPVMNAVSRAHERRADAYALRITNNPPAFISAMRRLGQQNLAEENPSRLVQALFYTHPPIRERLKAAQDRASAA